MYTDGHCHLADPRLKDVKKILHDCKSLGISRFVQAGFDPADWNRQLELQKQFGCFFMNFGLHPYFVSEHTVDECEAALDQLAKQLHLADGLGETGLDLRPDIVKDSFDRQMDCFEKQLELAEAFQKPVVLHLVRAFDEVQKVFATWGAPKNLGMVHAFSSNSKQAEYYLKQNLYLSIGGSVCHPNNKSLHQAVSMIPLESLIVESDSPDQAPYGWQNTLNTPDSIFWVARKIAEIKGISPEEILDSSSKNLEILFACKTNHRI
jgi:TatD DNase family protein